MAAVMLAASAALAAQSQAYMAKDPAIRSVVTRIEGHDNAPAVIIPGAGDRLTVSFDEESLESRQLRYRLIHCDPHWHPSQLIESEYIDGFNEAPLDDGTYSRATLTHYVHYGLTVPTDIIPTISGNYLIEIFDDYDTARPTLLSIPFGVSEQSVDIAATVSPRTDIDYLGAHQQLLIDLDLDRIWDEITRPYTDIIVTVEQDSRPETRVELTSPTAVTGRRARYDHLPQLIFKAGNEYRRMETVDTRRPGMSIASVGRDAGRFTAETEPAAARADSPYAYDRTQHGRMLVRTVDSDRPDTEADYVDTGFTLVSEPIEGCDVYIEGELTGRRLDETSRMDYDTTAGAYRLTLPLKQGAYNYRYLAVDRRTGRPIEGLIEGNFHQTVNEYTIRVYYRPRTARGYRLAGVTVITNDR